MFSTDEWLVTLLRRWDRKGYIPNVSLAESGGAPNVSLENGERSIALVQTTDERQFALTSDRIIEGDRTVLRYGDVSRCHWMTDKREPWTGAQLKRTHWHRLVFELKDGRKVVLEHLGQAVFPLLRFFESINSDLSG